MPNTLPAQVMARQLIRSATSVAANYRAVCRSRSRAEFIAKMSIVVEEADETLFWLELINESKISAPDPSLLDEAGEILSIMASSRKSAQTNHKITKSQNH
jgi:four helix bundle protein